MPARALQLQWRVVVLSCNWAANVRRRNTALAGFALQQNFEKQGGKEGKVKTAMDKMPVSD
jgi:hypothetical protein